MEPSSCSLASRKLLDLLPSEGGQSWGFREVGLQVPEKFLEQEALKAAQYLAGVENTACVHQPCFLLADLLSDLTPVSTPYRSVELLAREESRLLL